MKQMVCYRSIMSMVSLGVTCLSLLTSARMKYILHCLEERTLAVILSPCAAAAAGKSESSLCRLCFP